MSTVGAIGGPVCAEKVCEGLLASEPEELPSEIEARLWTVVENIGRAWDIEESTRLETRSQFRECVRLKTAESPSYLEEYRSAVRVLDELERLYGLPDAFDRLFFSNGIADEDKETRLHLLAASVDRIALYQTQSPTPSLLLLCD